MSKSIFRSIVIACAPRTGSNLLMHSLATHPQAVCGGEWYQWEESRMRSEWFRNKTDRPKAVNLCKVFAPEKIPFESMVVYLYRQDREAQLASWEKASGTGEWLAGYVSEPTEFPINASQIIDQAEVIYGPISQIAMSYETMVSQWNITIERILAAAGWNQIALEPATKKIL